MTRINLDFHPTELVKQITKRIPRSLPYYNNGDLETDADDPIVTELMKLRPHSSRLIISNILYNEEIVQYSAKLQELLYLLLEEKELDDNIRINVENSLSELTTSLPALNQDDYRLNNNNNNNNVSEPPTKKSKLQQNLPTPVPSQLTFPNNYLSKILIDNFDSLLKFSTSYFNLSLASHITKYVVELIYLLNYWEVIHLVYLNSNIINFLQLLDFEIVNGSFGPIVRPPENYLSDIMLQGLQYPYPYPFYNYSYHSFNSHVEEQKFRKISIIPYVDITLKNVDEPVQRKKRGRGRKAKNPLPKKEDNNPAIHNTEIQHPEVAKQATGKDEEPTAEASRTVSEVSEDEMEKQPQPKTSVKSSILSVTSVMNPSAINTEAVPVAIDAGKMSRVGGLASSTATPPTDTVSNADINPPSSYATQSGQALPKIGEFASSKQGSHFSVPRNDAFVNKTANLSISPISGHDYSTTNPYASYPYSQSSYQHQHQRHDKNKISLSQNSNPNTIPTIQPPNEMFVSGPQPELNYRNPSQDRSDNQSRLDHHSNLSAFHGVSPIANYQSETSNILPSIDRLTNNPTSQTGFSDIGHYPKRPSFGNSPTVGAFATRHNSTSKQHDHHLDQSILQSKESTSSQNYENKRENASRAGSQSIASEFPQRKISVEGRISDVDGASGAQNHLSAEEKAKKSKSGVIHQCHLLDAGSLEECSKIFYGKNELLRHQEFVHATKKKIYKCIYCARMGAKVQSYPRHDSLARHIRRKHGITGKENKMAVNYAKENVEIIDPDQLITKQHDFQEPVVSDSQGVFLPPKEGASQQQKSSQYQQEQPQFEQKLPLLPPQQQQYSDPIRFEKPAGIPQFMSKFGESGTQLPSLQLYSLGVSQRQPSTTYLSRYNTQPTQPQEIHKYDNPIPTVSLPVGSVPMRRPLPLEGKNTDNSSYYILANQSQSPSDMLEQPKKD